MKRNIYIPLLCAIMSTSVIGMDNNSTSTPAPGNYINIGGAIVPLVRSGTHLDRYQGSTHSGGTTNRQQRRQGPCKQSKIDKETKYIGKIDTKLQRISAGIDQQIMETECGYSAIAQLFYKMKQLAFSRSENPDILIQKLAEIDFDIGKANNASIVNVLMDKSYTFSNLVEKIINAYSSNLDMITGSTVDAFFNDPASMFPTLHRWLGAFIGKKVITNIEQQYENSIDYARPPFNEQWDSFLNEDQMCLVFRQAPEIHRIALTGHVCPIDKDSIQFSDNHRYVKATDTSGITLIWKTTTGELSDIDEEEYNWEPQNVYESNHQDYRNQVSFYGNDQYHVSLCDYIPVKLDASCIEAEIPTLYLYQRPTYVSWLARIALFHSLGNKEDLEEFKTSSVGNRLQGFVKINFEHEVKKAKKALKN